MANEPDDPTEVYNRRVFAWCSITIILVLSIVSYILRLWARRKSGQRLKADDWLMGVGLLISFIPAISGYVRKSKLTIFGSKDTTKVNNLQFLQMALVIIFGMSPLIRNIILLE
jgi:hypothetical protein